MQVKTHVIRGINQTKSKVQPYFSVFARKKALSFLTLSLLLIAIPLTVIQSLNTQDIRQRASGTGNYSSCRITCNTDFDKCKNACNTTLAQENETCSKINYLFNPAATEIEKELCYKSAKDKFNECLDKPGNPNTCIGKNNSCHSICFSLPSQCQEAGGSCVPEGSSNSTGQTRNDALSCETSKRDGIIKHCYVPNTPGTQPGSDDIPTSYSDTECKIKGGDNASCVAGDSSYSCPRDTGYIPLSCGNGIVCCHEDQTDFGRRYVTCMNSLDRDDAKCRTRIANGGGTAPPPTETPKTCFDKCIVYEDEQTCTKQCYPKSVCETGGNVCIPYQAEMEGTNKCSGAGYEKQISASCTGSSTGTICCQRKPIAPPSTPSECLKTNSEVNLRENFSASPTSRIQAKLQSGTNVTRLGSEIKNEGYTWWDVNVPSINKAGWIANTYISTCDGKPVGSAPVSSPAPKTPSPAPGGGGASPAPSSTGTITKDSIVSINGADGFANLRKLPGINQGIVDSIANGTKAKVTGGPKKATSGEDSYNWWEITIQEGKWKNTSGWMASIVLLPGSNTPSSGGGTPSAPGAGGKEDCLPSGFYAVGGEPCATPTPAQKTTGGGNQPTPNGGSSPAPSSPSSTSAPIQQTACSDNPIPAPANQVWRAYCSNKCVTSSDCKSLPGWPTNTASSQCYPFTNGSYCIQLQYNNIAGVCRDNPVTPPAGLQWKSSCGGKECTKNSDCPTTPGFENSNWCYGFDDGARCLSLQKADSSAPQKTLAQKSTNPLVSGWESVVTFFKNLF